jgi:hypothetical protein
VCAQEDGNDEDEARGGGQAPLGGAQEDGWSSWSWSSWRWTPGRWQRSWWSGSSSQSSRRWDEGHSWEEARDRGGQAPRSKFNRVEATEVPAYLYAQPSEPTKRSNNETHERYDDEDVMSLSWPLSVKDMNKTVGDSCYWNRMQQAALDIGCRMAHHCRKSAGVGQKTYKLSICGKWKWQLYDRLLSTLTEHHAWQLLGNPLPLSVELGAPSTETDPQIMHQLQARLLSCKLHCTLDMILYGWM